MCRIGAIKSKRKLHPSIALKLMRSQQEGHDDSGFAFVMQDMGGLFGNYKDLPLLSMAATVEGTRLAEDILRELGSVAEGVKTSKAICELAKKLDIEVPVSSAIYEAVYTDITPRELLDKLMNRKLKEEERYI